jgi:hypothetical protein
MGRPIEITRLEHSAAVLRELAAQTREGAVVRRLLGIALILEGRSRDEAARLSGDGSADTARLGASLQR